MRFHHFSKPSSSKTIWCIMNDVVGQLLIQFMTRTPPRSPSVQLSLPRSRTQRALGRGHANQLFSVLPKICRAVPWYLNRNESNHGCARITGWWPEAATVPAEFAKLAPTAYNY